MKFVILTTQLFKRVIISVTSAYYYAGWTIASPSGAFEFSLSGCMISLLAPYCPLLYTYAASRSSKSIIKGLDSTQNLSSVVATNEKSLTPKLVGLSPFAPPPAFIVLAAETM